MHASDLLELFSVRLLYVVVGESTAICSADMGSYLGVEVEVGRVSLWAKSRALLVAASFVAALRAVLPLLPSSQQPSWSPSRVGASLRAPATATQVPPVLCCVVLCCGTLTAQCVECTSVSDIGNFGDFASGRLLANGASE